MFGRALYGPLGDPDLYIPNLRRACSSKDRDHLTAWSTLDRTDHRASGLPCRARLYLHERLQQLHVAYQRYRDLHALRLVGLGICRRFSSTRESPLAATRMGVSARAQRRNGRTGPWVRGRSRRMMLARRILHTLPTAKQPSSGYASGEGGDVIICFARAVRVKVSRVRCTRRALWTGQNGYVSYVSVLPKLRPSSGRRVHHHSLDSLEVCDDAGTQR